VLERHIRIVIVVVLPTSPHRLKLQTSPHRLDSERLRQASREATSGRLSSIGCDCRTNVWIPSAWRGAALESGPTISRYSSQRLARRKSWQQAAPAKLPSVMFVNRRPVRIVSTR
jgi:hypothetical protein